MVRINDKYIVIYPYKFSDFLWHKLELEELSSLVDIEVWDISQILNKNFYEVLNYEPSKRKEIFSFTVKSKFYKHFDRFIQTNSSLNICIYNAVPNSNLKEILINNFLSSKLKRTNFKVIDIIAPGMPVLDNNIKFNKKMNNAFYTIIKIIKSSTSLKNLFSQTILYLVAFIAKYKKKYLTHLLVAGDFYKENIKNSPLFPPSLIEVSSLDYSEYLRKTRKLLPSKENGATCIAFLDANDPYFAGDGYLANHKDSITSDVWYPLLNNLFSFIESEFNLPVVICGHPKTNFISPCEIFDNRQVVYGKTCEVVSESKFIITRSSMAISFAVSMFKPILFVTSDQFETSHSGLMYKKEIEVLASFLDSKIVNLNEIHLKKMKPELKLNKDMYYKFIKNYLTSNFDKEANYEVILKKIMKLRID